jgi:hypothetical protein
MSWQIESEKRADRNMPVDSQAIIEELRSRAPDTVQAIVAIDAAEMLLEGIRTRYGIGCVVRVYCDGHQPDETLNNHPSHVNVRVVVDPVKYQR